MLPVMAAWTKAGWVTAAWGEGRMDHAAKGGKDHGGGMNESR